ncbi:MAG: sulfotransferase family protein [Flavobacteriaceae bacterium]|nr:sulfotransferase family protein [Flavobacteriaceae bacterium]
MKNKNIFIHIPKTGGTTINCAINKTDWQTKPDFNYRHIDYQTKRSNSADIFNPLKYDYYKDYNIFMLLRHPVDRIISEYSFIKTRPEFMSLIKPLPKDLISYVKNRQTQNYMIGFLVGKRMYDTNLVNQDDFELVSNTIRNSNIKVGIFEHYEASLNYFSQHTNIKWPKKLDVKRITLNRPKLNEVSEELSNLIIKHNALDFQLYNECLKTFESQVTLNKGSKINFNGNKYDYVLKFTERFNLLEIELKNLEFIHLNNIFFKSLNDYLHHNAKIKDGKIYINVWNDTVVKAFESKDKNASFTKQLQTISEKENASPLEMTIEIAKTIDRNYKSSPKQKIKYQNYLQFDSNNIVIPKSRKRFKWF